MIATSYTMTANPYPSAVMRPKSNSDPNPFVDPNPFPTPRAYRVVLEFWGDPKAQRTIRASGAIEAEFLRAREGLRLVAVVVAPAMGGDEDFFLLINDEFLGVDWVESALGPPNVVRFSCRHKKCPVPGWTLWSGGMQAVNGIGPERPTMQLVK